MAKEIKTVLSRSPATVLSDMIGLVALLVIFYTGLALPAVL